MIMGETVTKRRAERLTWGIPELAEATCTSVGFIRKGIAGKVPGKPKLPMVRVGGRNLITDKDAREWFGVQDESLAAA